RHTFDLHADVPRAVDRVDPGVRITGMNEDLFIFFEPRIHLVPIEGEVPRQRGSIASRLDVSASGIGRRSIPCDDTPANNVRALPHLVLSVKVPHRDVRNWEPICRRPSRLIEEKGAFTAGAQLTGEVRADPPRAAFDMHPLLQPGPLHAGWNEGPRECLSHLDVPFLAIDSNIGVAIAP